MSSPDREAVLQYFQGDYVDLNATTPVEKIKNLYDNLAETYEKVSLYCGSILLIQVFLLGQTPDRSLGGGFGRLNETLTLFKHEDVNFVTPSI